MFAFKMYKILIIIIIVLISTIYCKDTAPVFVIDYWNVIGDRLAANPLEAMSEKYFRKLLTKTKNCEFLIFFIEDKFCQEDINIKDAIGTPFHYLQEGMMERKIKYLPAVRKPYKILEKSFRPLSSNSHYVTSLNYKPDISIKNSKIAYIFFKDGKGESRAQVLRKHDVFMRDVYFTISRNSKKPVVAFYTGKENPIILDVIEYKMPSLRYMRNRYIVDPGLTVRSKRTLFHFRGMAKSIGGRRTFLDERPMFIGETDSQSTIKTKLSYPEFDLHFEIDYDSRYWTLRSVSCLVDNVPIAYRIIDMPINWGKSYLCGDPFVVRYRRDGDTVTIPHMQVQPLQERIGGDEHKLPPGVSDGDAHNLPPGAAGGAAGGAPGGVPEDEQQSFSFGAVEECTGYFSQAILSCLFVVVILLFVLHNATQMLMSIGTNDRFDDFKKPFSFGGHRAD